MLPEEARHRFEQLAAGLQKPVYNTAVRLAGSVEDGVTLARRALLEAYAHYERDPRSAPFRVMVYASLVDLLDQAPDPDELSEPAWLQQALRDDEPDDLSIPQTPGGAFFAGVEGPVEYAMHRLPRDLRLVVILCDVEGFSYSQVARLTRKSRLWVAGALHSGRKLLRASIRDQTRRRPPIEH